MQVNHSIFSTGLRVNRIKLFITAYDGEGDTPTPAPTPPPIIVEPPVVQNVDGTFQMTQDKLNDIITKRLEQERKQGDERLKTREAELVSSAKQSSDALLADKTALLSELQSIKGVHKGTEEEKATLQARIDTLKSETMSSEEQSQQRIAELEERVTKTESTSVEQLSVVNKAYEDFRIDTELRSAILANDAVKPDQLFALLRGQTAKKQKLDDSGNEVAGQFDIMTSIDVIDDKGVKTKVELSPAEAVIKLRANVEEWGNQFGSKQKGGSGLTNDDKGESGSDTPPSDYAGYKKWKKDNPTKAKLLTRGEDKF